MECIVFTGGRAEGDRLSEAEAARDYALAKGIPRSAICLETTSTSTHGNLSNANGIMQRLGMRTAVIVSDPYHLLRAGMIADRIGIAHELSPTPTSRYKTFGMKASQLSRESYYITSPLTDWTLAPSMLRFGPCGFKQLSTWSPKIFRRSNCVLVSQRHFNGGDKLKYPETTVDSGTTLNVPESP